MKGIKIRPSRPGGMAASGGYQHELIIGGGNLDNVIGLTDAELIQLDHAVSEYRQQADRPTTADLDAVMRLVGDEDGGVGIDCRVCDRGGAPVAYYPGSDTRAYAGTDVEQVRTIAELVAAGRRHAGDHAE